MKIIATFAAAGTLAIAAAPAQAAEIARSISPDLGAPTVMMLPLDQLTPTAHYYDDDWDDDYEYRRGRGHSRYDRYGRYREPRKIRRGDRVWRGRDGRYYCKRDNGTTGLIIGAGVGALLGREVDRRGDRTLGTVLGAVAGGL
ncbi:MAG: glycine zipper 2TM domain-containing protein, partial [Pseudomonadota bacterium]